MPRNGSPSAFVTVCISFLIASVRGSCPNACSHHGTCDKYSRCHCATGFQGADCSEKICPFATAWTDAATGVDTAHAPAECSNRGICERTAGKCQCMEGFTGSACERLTCHDDCSGRGICYTMRNFALRTRNDMSVAYTYENVWDHDKISGCYCDTNTAGYDCSLQLCPNGDDPLTTGQVNEVQLLRCIANQGSFVLYYNGFPSSWISHTASASAVREALRKIPLISDVKVTFSKPGGYVCQLQSNVVQIEFIEQFGSLNPLVAYLDDTLTANGGGLAISADGVTEFEDAVSGKAYRSRKGTKEADLCAGRGRCNLEQGFCSCFDTNGDVYASSDGYGNAGPRGDCGHVLSASRTVVSTCPGEIPCSGHGICDSASSSYRCTCSEGWSGGDCSEKVCPQGLSWFAYPVGNDEAHLSYDTCSNMGICDTRTGKCQCRANFYGQACEYMTCGGGLENACSGHGRCMTMAELALWSENNGNAASYIYGSDVNNYATWDYDRMHGCLCDSGYSGYDCSLIDCPKGDDPGTYDDHVEVQLLRCTADAGNFTLSFRQAETPQLQYNITAQELREVMVRSMATTIRNISVYFIMDGIPPEGVLDFVAPEKAQAFGTPPWGEFIDGRFQYVPQDVVLRGENSTFCNTNGTQVAIVEFAYTHGNLPPLLTRTKFLQDFVNKNGEPGTGTIEVYQDGAYVFNLQSVQGTTEVDYCNNRGLCDFKTGVCDCFEDWTSSDGARQGKAGSTADCGYRNDRKYSYFKSDGGPF